MKINGLEYPDDDVELMVNSSMMQIDRQLCLLTTAGVITKEKRMEVLNSLGIEIKNVCGSCSLQWCNENKPNDES